MTVYFVYRSHWEGPTSKHLKRFDDPSVLAWFRNHWHRIADPGAAHQQVSQLLGCRVYGFASLFEAIAEHDLPPPETDEQLEAYLREHPYVEGESLYAPHLLQVFSRTL